MSCSNCEKKLVGLGPFHLHIKHFWRTISRARIGTRRKLEHGLFGYIHVAAVVETKQREFKGCRRDDAKAHFTRLSGNTAPLRGHGKIAKEKRKGPPIWRNHVTYGPWTTTRSSVGDSSDLHVRWVGSLQHISDDEVATLVDAVAQKVLRYLQKKRYLSKDGDIVSNPLADDVFRDHDALSMATSRGLAEGSVMAKKYL